MKIFRGIKKTRHWSISGILYRFITNRINDLLILVMSISK